MVDVFRNYDSSRLDSQNEFYRQKIDNFNAAKAAYASGQICLSHYPLRATLQTTERCNLKCPMCQIHGAPVKRKLVGMSRKNLAKSIKELFPFLLEFHPSNIGEPLVHKWFEELCLEAKKYGVMMDLTTNGTLLDPRRIDFILPILLDVKISWDGVTKKTFEAIRKGADFNQMVDNLERLVKVRNSQNPSASISLQMTVMKSNYREILDLLVFAAEKGVDRVKAYHMFSHREEMDAETMIMDLDAFEKVRIQAIKLAQDLGIQLEISEPPAKPGGCNNLIKQACRLLWTECWIDVDGAIFPCHSHQNLNFGSIQSASFRSSWNSDLFQELRKAQAMQDPVSICKGCGMNYLKKDENQQVEIDAENYLSGKPTNTEMRWSSRSKQFEIHRK